MMMAIGVLMAVGMCIAMAALVILAAIVLLNSTPAKRKRQTYDTNAYTDTLYDEKPKRRTKYILSDDGEILEVVDNDRQADESIENYINMPRGTH